MGIVAIFATMGFVGFLFGTIFSREWRGTCAIALAICLVVVVVGFGIEIYSGNNPKIEEEEYKTFLISSEYQQVEFENPVLVKKITTTYFLSFFYSKPVVYKIKSLEE